MEDRWRLLRDFWKQENAIFIDIPVHEWVRQSAALSSLITGRQQKPWLPRSVLPHKSCLNTYCYHGNLVRTSLQQFHQLNIGRVLFSHRQRMSSIALCLCQRWLWTWCVSLILDILVHVEWFFACSSFAFLCKYWHLASSHAIIGHSCIKSLFKFFNLFYWIVSYY